MIINIEPIDNYEFIFSDSIKVVSDKFIVLEYILLYKQSSVTLFKELIQN